MTAAPVAHVMHDIEITALRKSFGPNEVLHGIDLTIRSGEFVGLMGPNGAGKSTLIKILGGVYERTSGEIRYGGEPVDSLAQRREVGFIHQDLGLVEDQSIVDNLRLGEAPVRRMGPLLDRRRERAMAEQAIARVALDRPVETLVADLSPGEKTLVAVARCLDRGAHVLFIDEATSTLPPTDAQRLIDALERTVAEGSTVIMVSHKLSEILDATHRIVVLLDGDVAADVESSELDRDGLVQMLVSHEAQSHADEHVPRAPGEDVLRLEGVHGGRAGPVDLTLREGEITGLTGLPGSGLHDVAYLVHGSLKPQAGTIWRRDGVETALVPPHRESQGGFAELDVLANMTVSSLPAWRSPLRFLRQRRERRDADAMIDRLGVAPRDPETAFGTLSGGNKQKVIFGRVLFCGPQVYVLCEPTRGVDVGTRNAIYRLIHELRDSGAAVLVVTSDSEDLFAVCDRIAVVDRGRPGEFLSAETDAEQLEAFI